MKLRSLLTALAVLAIAGSGAGCHRIERMLGMGPANSVRKACAADMQTFCADVDRSGMRKCMSDHADQLSAPCKAALAARRAAMSSSAPAASSAAASSAASSSASSSQ